MPSRRRVEALDLRLLDVDPPKFLRPITPQRRLAKLIPTIDDTLDRGECRHFKVSLRWLCRTVSPERIRSRPSKVRIPCAY